MTSTDKEGILDKYFYSYNNVGLISGINRERRDLDAISGQYDYQYDEIGRLTRSSLNGELRASYEYDAFGNRTSLTERDAQTTYRYDALDRLVEAKELSRDLTTYDDLIPNKSQAIVRSYNYDKRGNQTSEYVDGLLNKTFTFDATNMLSKVIDSEKGELENQYNGLGFRVASTRPEERIEYLCDLSRDYYNLLERTVNGETESFIYDKNVISMSKAGNSYYYLQDELGSPMYMTGTDGATVSSYAFDDFGRGIDPFTGKIEEHRNKHTNGIVEPCDKHAYTKEGNIIQPFAFTGYQEDEVSGLMFAQARFYNSQNGRFVGEDKVRGYINKPDSINHYLYCWNSPTVRIDYNGKDSYYIFYSETDFSWQAMSRYYELINLPDTEITEVDLYFHSNPTTLIMPNNKYGINPSGVSSSGNEIGKFSDLDKKTIDTVSFVSCNSGRIESSDNIASIFVNTQDVGKVYAWNGSVSFSWGLQTVVIGSGMFAVTATVLHATPKVSKTQHIDSEYPFGQVCYYKKNGKIYYYYVDDPEHAYEYLGADGCDH